MNDILKTPEGYVVARRGNMHYVYHKGDKGISFLIGSVNRTNRGVIYCGSDMSGLAPCTGNFYEVVKILCTRHRMGLNDRRM